MAGFGGAVKLTGESEYKKALSEITQSLKVVTAEMKATSSAFQADNASKKETIQTTQQLKQSLEAQGTALAKLKSELAAMQAEYAKTSATHNALLKNYDAEKAKLDQIGNTLGKSSEEYQAQEKVVAALSDEVADSTKSYDAQTKALNTMTIQTANAETTFNQTTKALDDLGESAEKGGKKAQDSSKGWTVMKQVLADLATTAIKGAVDGLKKLGQTFVDIGKQAYSSYASYEQLKGGVEKLFGEDMQKVLDNADRAFSTAGMSANQYMETVTNFSASLISGLGGDTKKAAEYADMAIQDMSDNANTFGTSMESVQYAYQGFAKQNYTMLDNLKLGYGGTKEEMARLVRESGILGEAGKDLTAKNLDQKVSYDQIIEAIHITQQRMKITGTTANEAAGTIEGATGSMKAAWQNMITGIANQNADFGKLSSQFVESLIHVVDNAVPRIIAIVEGLARALETTIPPLLDSIIDIVMKNLPSLLNAVQSALSSILALIPKIMPVIAQIIPQIVNILVSMLPQIIDAGIEIILALIEGISDAIPKLTASIPQVVTAIVQSLAKQLPNIIQAGLNLLLGLVDGIIKAIPQIVAALPKVITSIVNAIIGSIPKIIDAGVQLLTSLVKNLPAIISGVVKAIPEIVIGLVKAISNNTAKIVEAGVNLLVALIKNLPQIIVEVVKAVPQIISALVRGFAGGVAELAKVGLELIKGLWSGIANAADWLWDKVKGFCGGVVSKIKGFFGIHSPSTVFRDEIGANLAEGIGEGFAETMNGVSKDMANAIPTNFDVNPRINGSTATSAGNAYAYTDMVAAFKDALSQMKIELDDEVAGKFVENTVTRAIYA